MIQDANGLRPAGRFITFEGGEGSGKTTQISRAAAFLSEHGRKVVTTREPGGTVGADALRTIILSGEAQGLGPEAEAVLFAAARADHVARVVKPALFSGADVLCDRFHDSTRVYQSDVDAALLDLLDDVALLGLRPDLTIVLDIPAASGLSRAATRRSEEAPDRFEGEALELHEARRERFLAIARAQPERCRIVDADRSADAVGQDIARILGAKLEGAVDLARAGISS